MTKFGVPTDEQLAKINKLAMRTLSKDETFVWSNSSAGDMLIPYRFTRISPELLNVMVDDANHGVSFMYNHSWSEFGSKGVPYGKVFDGRVVDSNKEGQSVELYLDKFIFKDAEIVDGISANAIIKRIETGILSDTSISFNTDKMVCSICGMNYWGGQCSHYRGRTYDMADGTKKLCTVTAMPPSIIIPYNNNALYEESICWDGAYPGAMVSQARNGDIIELPTGNFAVLGDKEELPEHTTFINKYSKGNILTLVKKSEHKKNYNLGGIDEGKKGADVSVNEKLKKMLEAFGVEITDGQEINIDVLNQLGEKWDDVTETIKASVEPLQPLEGEPLQLSDEFLGIPVKEIKEKLGADLTADNVLNLAKEGQEYRKQLSDDAVAMGVRAMGNDFPKETWEQSFVNMNTKSIKDIMGTWELQAKSAIKDGRVSDPQAGDGKQTFSVPDKAFKVGR